MNTFMTAEQLGIAEWEREGMIHVLARLEGEGYGGGADEFNMNQDMHCIGGKVFKWAGEECGYKSAGEYVESKAYPARRELFFPREWTASNWDHIPPEAAGWALHSYLTHGRADWARACSLFGYMVNEEWDGIEANPLGTI